MANSKHSFHWPNFFVRARQGPGGPPRELSRRDTFKKRHFTPIGKSFKKSGPKFFFKKCSEKQLFCVVAFSLEILGSLRKFGTFWVKKKFFSFENFLFPKLYLFHFRPRKKKISKGLLFATKMPQIHFWNATNPLFDCHNGGL